MDEYTKFTSTAASRANTISTNPTQSQCWSSPGNYGTYVPCDGPGTHVLKSISSPREGYWILPQTSPVCTVFVPSYYLALYLDVIHRLLSLSVSVPGVFSLEFVCLLNRGPQWCGAALSSFVLIRSFKTGWGGQGHWQSRLRVHWKARMGSSKAMFGSSSGHFQRCGGQAVRGDDIAKNWPCCKGW